MLHACETFCQALVVERSNCQQVKRLLLFKQIVDGFYHPVFQDIAAVDFVQQFVQASNAKQIMLNSTKHSLKQSPSH